MSKQEWMGMTSGLVTLRLLLTVLSSRVLVISSLSALDDGDESVGNISRCMDMELVIWI